MTTINSPHNERIRWVRQLQQQAKIRREHRRAVLEGVRLMRDALASGALPDYACYVPEAAAPGTPAASLIYDLRARRVACLAVTETLMRGMSDTETPQGILGVFPWPDLPVPPSPALIVVLDGWRDPGNLGTVIRTAAAAGVELLALMPGTVDAFNPKVVRAAMGGHYRIPIRALDWAALVADYGDERAFYLAGADGATRYDAVDWTRPAAIVIGGEAHGPGPAAHAIAHTTVYIPMTAGAESLNAAVAASLLIYEARRHSWRSG